MITPQDIFPCICLIKLDSWQGKKNTQAIVILRCLQREYHTVHWDFVSYLHGFLVMLHMFFPKVWKVYITCNKNMIEPFIYKQVSLTKSSDEYDKIIRWKHIILFMTDNKLYFFSFRDSDKEILLVNCDMTCCYHFLSL